MAFRISQPEKEEVTTVRVVLPLSMKQKLEGLAKSSGVDLQEAIRQALVFALHSAERKPRVKKEQKHD